MAAIIIGIKELRKERIANLSKAFEMALNAVQKADEHEDESIGAPSVDICNAWHVVMQAATNRNHRIKLRKVQKCVNLVQAFLTNKGALRG